MVQVTEVSSEYEDMQGRPSVSDSEEEEEGASSPLWQNVIVLIIAALVIQAQVFFVSGVFNLVLRRWILPKGIAFQHPFHPDYQEAQPVAYIPMLENKYLTSGQISEAPKESGLLVSDGSYFDVWLKFSLPYSAENQALFQVQVDLLALNSSVVFSDRKACMMKRDSFSFKHMKLLAFAPLYLFGFMDEGKESLYFPVVNRFQQGKLGKVSQVKVSLLPQKDKKPPEIYEAEAHVLIKLNLLQHFMYHYPLSSFIILSCATAIFLNSILLGLVFVVLLAILFGGSGNNTGEEDGEGDKEDYTEGSGADRSAFSDMSPDTNFELNDDGGASKGEGNNSEEEDSGQVTSWEQATSDASNDTTSNEAKILKAASSPRKNYITETRQRKT